MTRLQEIIRQLSRENIEAKVNGKGGRILNSFEMAQILIAIDTAIGQVNDSNYKTDIEKLLYQCDGSEPAIDTEVIISNLTKLDESAAKG